jgi:hypothetical protein
VLLSESDPAGRAFGRQASSRSDEKSMLAESYEFPEMYTFCPV